MLILQCIREDRNRIITLPAAFTDYNKAQTSPSDTIPETYFTVEGLTEVDLMVRRIYNTSTK